MKKYRIEVEQRDSPRPWEWRVWTRKADGTFDADFDVSGSERSAVCPKSHSGLHEFERLPPKQGWPTLDREDWHVMRRPSDMQCTLCGKLYSEHVT